MGDKEKSQFLRAEKYAMQSVVRDWLPDSRTSICLRNRIHKKGEDEAELVRVWQHKETKKAFYSGLVVCGSVWTCPICAAKISERRKEELKKAFEIHKARGGKVVMLTFTFSHKREDKLKDLLNRFAKAQQSFFRGNTYKKMADEMGLIGRVRAFEIRYGDANGWHPHTHYALFVTKDFNLNQMESKMWKRWKTFLNKNNLTADRKHGIDLRIANTVENYLAKGSVWSTEFELTKGHSKKGKTGSRSPFDFLRMYLDQDEDNPLLKKLFIDYAESFRGKRQLQWSRGLKEMFLIEDKTDEELAKEKKEEAYELGFFSTAEWIYIRKNDLRSKILDMTENEGFEVTYKWLVEQMYKYKKSLPTGNIDKDIVE